MARDKERSINPAQQQRKLDKAKALRKSRAELQSRRNEKLAKRNPDRIQKQIDDLRALETSGDIKPREKAILEELERDLRAVKKARDAVGDKGRPQSDIKTRPGRDEDRGAVLGKRRHDGERKYPFQHRHDSSGSDTDDSVRRIPMPEDTPPPIPRESRRFYNNTRPVDSPPGQDRPDTSLPQRPPAAMFESKTTYSSAPLIRDLKKEAVSRFVPNVVRQKQDAVKGVGGRLIEPEDLDRLEAAGYGKTLSVSFQDDGVATMDGSREDADVDTDAAKRLMEEEERRFQQELEMDEEDVGSKQDETKTISRPVRTVQIEEVEDEDG